MEVYDSQGLLHRYGILEKDFSACVWKESLEIFKMFALFLVTLFRGPTKE